MSKRSRYGAVRICLEPDEPSAGIVRVEALSPWRRANSNFSRNTLSANLSWQLFEKLLHLPASRANFSRGTSPANIACQLFESYFACQLLAPTFRELLRLPTSHANFSKVTSPAGFSRQLFESYFTRHLLVPTFRELLHLPASRANFSRVTSPNFSRVTSPANFSSSPANFSCQLCENYFTRQLCQPTIRELLNLPASHAKFLRIASPANSSC